MIKIGVVGVGYLGRFHAQKLKEIENAELVGVYDLNWNRTQVIAEEVHTQPYRDIETLYKDIDAVSVAAPTSSHFELVQSALENNLHVFVEKPIAMTSREGEVLTTLSREQSKLLQVGHIERFNPVFCSIKDKLDSCCNFYFKRLAEFKERALDVDIVTDLMIHDIDLLLNFLNESPIGIEAVGEKVRTEKYDKAIVKLFFKNEKKAILEASRVHTHPCRTMTAQGDKFSIFANLLESHYKIKYLEGEENCHRVEKKDLLCEEFSFFINSILNNKPSICNGESATKNLKIVESILENIDSSS